MTARLLIIYLNNQPVGELRQEGPDLSFCYEGGYLSRANALPLSRYLPLQKSRFGDFPSRAFFANLLPEGEIRTQIARQLGVSPGNIFALLSAIGGDCAGAVSLLPPSVLPGKGDDYQAITDADLCSRLDDLPAHPLLAGEAGVRLSLAGAQNKLPIYWDGRRYYIPRGSSPSSHILKTAIPQLVDTVINEAFCMNLAQRSGMPVPGAEVVAINGRQVYRVERYDRRRLADGTRERLHQEDFCQALGVLPELKYEAEGGPGLRDCFQLAAEWSDEPALDALLLIRWSLFNFLICNADAHAKNLSFLYCDGQIRLAPFYDLLSTAVYARLNNKFAMRIGGQKDPRYLMTQHVARFAADSGIAQRVLIEEWGNLVQRMESGIAALAAEYDDKFERPAIIADICRIVSKRSAKGREVFGL
jgi:serine/threonine-protein kinase HipA